MSKNCDVNYAEYCIERWARWALDDNGFPATSPVAKLGDSGGGKGGHSQVPHGVEITCMDVVNTIQVFKLMIDSSEKSAKRAHLLRSISLGRVEGESISRAMKRMGLGSRRADYYAAIEEFSIRLDMMNIVITN